MGHVVSHDPITIENGYLGNVCMFVSTQTYGNSGRLYAPHC